MQRIHYAVNVEQGEETAMSPIRRSKPPRDSSKLDYVEVMSVGEVVGTIESGKLDLDNTTSRDSTPFCRVYLKGSQRTSDCQQTRNLVRSYPLQTVTFNTGKPVITPWAPSSQNRRALNSLAGPVGNALTDEGTPIDISPFLLAPATLLVTLASVVSVRVRCQLCRRARETEWQEANSRHQWCKAPLYWGRDIEVRQLKWDALQTRKEGVARYCRPYRSRNSSGRNGWHQQNIKEVILFGQVKKATLWWQQSPGSTRFKKTRHKTNRSHKEQCRGPHYASRN